jgi:hypothetical protein
MTTSCRALWATALAGIALALPRTAAAQHTDHAGHRSGLPGIPASIRAEHQEIHARLEAATRAPGATGRAARELAAVLHPHFEREEQIALPPLGLLGPLSRGEFTADMLAVLPLADSLRAELPRMLEEHVAIHAATARLGEAARLENQAEAAELAQALALHAQGEEEVFYPAAVLVGDLLRSRR